ncbi:MAG: FtsX-like permease family protein [Candidatus Thorarchaeota archaeon]
MELEFAKMGLKNAFRRKRVAAFTVFSIALAVSLLYTSLSTNAGLQHSANTFIQESLAPVDILVNTYRYNDRINQSAIDDILAIPGVVSAIPRIEVDAETRLGNDTLYFLLVGIDLQAESHIGSLNITAGELDLSDQGCFVSGEARDLLGFDLGEEINFTVTSGIHFLDVTGTGLVIDKGLFGPVVFVSLETAWDIFSILFKENSVNTLLIEVDDVFATPYQVNHISSLMGNQFVITNLKEYHLRLVNSFMTYARSILGALAISSFFIAWSRVMSSFAKVFGERKYETGVMLAFGGSQRHVMAVFLSELLIIGILGAIMGAIIGALMGNVFLNILQLQAGLGAIGTTVQFFNSPYSIDFGSLLLAGAAGVGITVVSGYVPAWRASREPLVKSLGTGLMATHTSSLKISPRTARIIWISSALASILLLGIVTLQVASDLLNLRFISNDYLRLLSIPAILLVLASLSPRLANTQRILKLLVSRGSDLIRKLSSHNLRRNTLNALVIFNLFSAITVLFFVSANAGYAVTDSWATTVGGQSSSANIVVHLDPPSDIGIVTQISSMSNITRVVPTNQDIDFLTHEQSLETGVVLGVEPTGFEQISSLGILESTNSTLGLNILNDPMTCVVSEYTARKLDVSLGDLIQLASGVEVTVGAICVSAVPVFVMTIVSPIFVLVGFETWSSIYSKPFLVGSLLIESSSPVSTVNTISDIPGMFPILVSELQGDVLANVEMIELYMDSSLYALVVMASGSAVLSGWAIASTRKREIGLLASMGMTHSEIASTLTVETSVAMISGVATGIFAGFFVEIALLEILQRFGSTSFAFIDLRTISLVLLSLILSIVAAFVAIRRAANTEVIRLLRDLSRE